MQKLLLMIGSLALLVGLLVAPALAAPTADLAALAAYFPDTTIMFFSLRTDAGAIENLDGLLGRLSRLLPGAVPPTTITEALDVAALAETERPFAESIRPWLGDTLAVALTGLDLDSRVPPVQAALAIRDQAGAAEFLAAALAPELARGDYVRQDGPAIVFRQQTQFGTPAVFTVTEDALIFTPDAPFTLSLIHI